jgi:DNA-binding CsgD family transcriptional regulator
VADQGQHAQQELAEPLEWFAGAPLFFRGQAMTYAGRFAEAEELARDQHHQALLDHAQEPQAFFAWQLSNVALHRGELATAVAHGQEAVALFSAMGRRPFEVASSTSLVIALAQLGRPADAIESLRHFEAEGCPSYYPVDVLEAQAWTAVAQGDIPEAHRLLREAADLAHRGGDRVGEAASLSALARIGYAGDVHLRLDELAQHVEGPLVSYNAQRAVYVTRGDAPALDRLSESYEAIHAILLAAECAAEAACAWRHREEERKAVLAERRAAALAERCGEVTTPALAMAGPRARLTPTELQIANLAQAGLTDKAIAEELFVSPRTVGNHLSRVYHKLGISGRDELRVSKPALNG